MSPSGRLICRYPKLLVVIATLLLLGDARATSDDYDKFELAAGGYAVFQYDSAVSPTELNVGVGISFSPRDTLGLGGEQTVFRLDGRHHFTPNHALTFSW